MLSALQQPCTSEELQRRHSGVYTRLSSACRTVVSVPLAVALTGDRRCTERHGSILLHLPRRVWVGIEATTDDVVDCEILEYHTADDLFTPAPSTLLERYRRLLGVVTTQVRRRFHVVIEAQDGYSATVAASLTAATTLALQLDEGSLDPAQVVAWSERPLAALLDDPTFRAVLDAGRSKQSLLRPGRNVFGSGIVTALAPGATQCLAFDEERVVSLTTASFAERDVHPSEWPVDLVVLGSGTRNELGLSPSYVELDEPLELYLAQLRELYPSSFSLTQPLEDEEGAAVAALQDRLWLNTYRQWTALWGPLEPACASAGLIEAIQRRTAFSFAVERIHPALRTISDAVRETCGAWRVGLMALGTWEHGGSCMVVAPASEHRRALPALLERLRAAGLDASVEYLSWRDGSAHDGARVEQHLSSERVSRHLPAHPLRTLQLTSRGVTQRIDHRTGTSPSVDVHVDLRTERVSIAGAAVSARELPSQRMCADVLRLLALSKDCTIRSTDLPRSSYRSSRGELGSKVLHPLSATVLVRTGKRLTFTTSGSISDFSIRLDPGESVIEITGPVMPSTTSR